MRDQDFGLGPVLWWRTAATRPRWPRLDGAASADVAVVGAGFTGLGAALELAEAGARVTVLEARAPGAGASGRSAGFVVPNLARADPAALRRAYGIERGERLARAIGAGAGRVFATAARLGVGSAQQSGWLQPVARARSRAAAEARYRDWRTLGQPAQWLQPAEAAELCGLRGLAGAWLDRSGGVLQPFDYLHALAAAVVRHGGRVYGRSPVRSLSRERGGWRLVTPHGVLRAARVLICTNGAGFGGVEILSETVLPVTVCQIATTPLPAGLRRRLNPRGCSVSDTRRHIFTYRFDPAGRLITGAVPLWDRDAEKRLAPALLRRLADELSLPQLPSLDTVWRGRIALTPDGLPRLYRPAPGVWAAVGCNGRGIVMSAVLARMLAGLALDVDSAPPLPLSPLRPLRWRRLAPALVKTTLVSGRLRDRLER